ncbi:Strigolactone esterase D14 [Linum perenne]
MVMQSSLKEAMNARTFGSTSRWSETIVLAHGFGGDQSAWDDIIPVLTQHYQVVSFDWCFSGAIKDPNFYDHDKYSSYDSFADDLICLIEEMGLHSVVFLGHSMSGMIGCIASIKRPQLFKRLVLVGASPRIYERGGLRRRIRGLTHRRPHQQHTDQFLQVGSFLCCHGHRKRR